METETIRESESPRVFCDAAKASIAEHHVRDAPRFSTAASRHMATESRSACGAATAGPALTCATVLTAEDRRRNSRHRSNRRPRGDARDRLLERVFPYSRLIKVSNDATESRSLRRYGWRVSFPLRGTRASNGRGSRVIRIWGGLKDRNQCYMRCRTWVGMSSVT